MIRDSHMSIMPTKEGFTLIELLVVIAIIGMLASIVFVSLNGVRVKARDAVRQYDMNQFVTALELYYSKYGVYPCGDSGIKPDTGTPFYTGPDGNPGTFNDTLWDPYSGPDPFLDGIPEPNPLCLNKSGAQVAVGAADSYGIYHEGLYPVALKQDPIQSPSGGGSIYTYLYEVTMDRQRYILFNLLEQNPAAMSKDGGLCSNYYEAGPFVGILAPVTTSIYEPLPDCIP